MSQSRHELGRYGVQLFQRVGKYRIGVERIPSKISGLFLYCYKWFHSWDDY